MISSSHPLVYSTQPLLSWLIPYDHRVIVSPLDQATVGAQLAATIERLNAAPAPGWFSSDARYEGQFAGDSFTLNGPIANRRFRLHTRGVLRIDPAGTRIDLTLRLATAYLLLALGQVAFLWAWALIVHFPLVLVLFLNSFLYIATTLTVKYEASQIVQRLLQAAGPPPEPEAHSAIVSDGSGWRCGACGGYVRRDATFCKHCKQPFAR